MIRTSRNRVSAGTLALTLFFLCTSDLGAGNPEPPDRYRHVNAMVEAGRGMVMRINAAARGGSLTDVRSNAEKGAHYGEAMLREANAALNLVISLGGEPDLNPESRQYLKHAISHLREAIKHGQTAVMHAHHATLSKTLRSSLSHARESAKHARLSALNAVEGEGYVRII